MPINPTTGMLSIPTMSVYNHLTGYAFGWEEGIRDTGAHFLVLSSIY